MSSIPSSRLAEAIVDWVEVGIFVVDRQMNITMWNHYMVHHSKIESSQAVGKNLFELFPELPRTWLEKKINSVFILKNFAFTSWEQRPWLFKFDHHRPITGGIDSMQQNCTFMPIKNEEGEVDQVCVTLIDATDTAIFQRQLHEANDRLRESSNRDGLTGIYNRRFLNERTLQEFSRVRRHGGDFSLILFDLDHFKKVNDTYGHLGGDEVLREVAKRVGGQLRDTDLFGRYGGEEFQIILPDTDIYGAFTLAERVRISIQAQPIAFGELQIPQTISLGVTEHRLDMPSVEAMLQEADLALYHSKRNGRNQVTMFDPDIHQE